MSSRVYKRKLSDTEKSYMVLNHKETLSIIQIVIEGHGNIDICDIKKAASEVSKFFPDSTVGISRGMWVSKFTETKVVKVNAYGWCGSDFDDHHVKANVFSKRMNPYQDSLCDIYLIDKGDKQYSIVFRIFHGIMDGQGALLYIKSIMQNLRGEKPIRPNFNKLDVDLVREVGAFTKKTKLSFNQKFHKKSSGILNKKMHWKRVILYKNYMGIVPKIAKMLSFFFRNSNHLVIIPTDLRRHRGNTIATGNLSLPIYLNYNKGEEWSLIYKNLFKELQSKNELNLKNAEWGYFSKLPMFIYQILLSSIILYQNFSSKYLCCGTISSLGKVDLDLFSTSSFSATSLFSMATHQPLVPISFAVTEIAGKTEITFSAYKNIFGQKDMEEIVDQIKSIFQ